MNRLNFQPPRNFSPKIILDICKQPRISSLEFSRIYPEAKIFSGQYDNQNFLVDKNSLAYHDNIKLKFIDLINFNVDEFIYHNGLSGKLIDFIKLDVNGKEKDIFKLKDSDWPRMTKYIKARLTDYNYQEAKRDLAWHGFDTWSIYDGIWFYVVGESKYV